ncbi:unnamed protein product [Cuscuta campestris]|uniref:HAT C-terminal dimerisation domain-containing protein n=1 Tax=Cuscuta campestris TaxID=132261 RepID=A0A484N0Q9_9ASTE|nr:unnamed protein product [Cuscuta campestris]
MRAYMQKTSRKPSMRFEDVVSNNETLEEAATHLEPPSSTDATSHPSSGTASKRKQSVSRFFESQEKAPKQTKSVASMLRKTPEEVVDERHTKGAYQSTIESTTRSKEERERVLMHIADFFFENNISFNAANSRSYEVMVESKGQYGPGLKPPIFHELRVPLLEKAKKETEKLKEKHEISWNEHGCMLILSATEAGKRVSDIIFSSSFWATVEDSLRATHPLLLVLRIVDADEKPAMPELLLAMDLAKSKITHALQAKPTKLRKVMEIIENRWEDQMGVNLYSAALFLNPSKYFDLKKKDAIAASHHRMIFNDVLEKIIPDESLQGKLMDQVTQYDKLRGSFAKQLAINQQKTKSPIDWWDAFGGFTIELQTLAKRIIGLCCTSSGCKRNWSTFEHIHSKKRNRLEHKRLNDLVFIKYNRRIATRFQKRQEQGTDFNPLIYEDFQWDNKWVSNEVVHPGQDLLWTTVDEAMGASTNLEGRNAPRRGCTSEANQGASSSVATYQRQRRSTSGAPLPAQESQDGDCHGEPDVFPNDDEDVEDDFGQAPPSPHHSAQNSSNDVFDSTCLEDF